MLAKAKLRGLAHPYLPASGAVPSEAVPSEAVPSEAVPSGAVPSQVVPSGLLHRRFLVGRPSAPAADSSGHDFVEEEAFLGGACLVLVLVLAAPLPCPCPCFVEEEAYLAASAAVEEAYLAASAAAEEAFHTQVLRQEERRRIAAAVACLASAVQGAVRRTLVVQVGRGHHRIVRLVPDNLHCREGLGQEAERPGLGQEAERPGLPVAEHSDYTSFFMCGLIEFYQTKSFTENNYSE